MFSKYYWTVLFLVLLVFNCGFMNAKESLDYYWRDYHGDIPEDAVPGGLDKNNKTTYIGAMPVLEYGIFPTRIYPGVKDLYASYYGIHKGYKFVQILCSRNPQNFIWILTRAHEIHARTQGKHLVEGGNENNTYLNIGRAQYQGELMVGKVPAYLGADALLRFPYEDHEIYLPFYEVLVYEKRGF